MILTESNQVHNLGRIFIDPNFQNQGIGMKVMKEIESFFPDSNKWWLDTPNWSFKIITSIQSADLPRLE